MSAYAKKGPLAKFCGVCGQPFAVEWPRQTTKYCSKRCARVPKEAVRLRNVAEKECLWCAGAFRPRERETVFCSVSCAGQARGQARLELGIGRSRRRERQAAKDARRAVSDVARTRTCPQCALSFRAAHRDGGVYCSVPCRAAAQAVLFRERYSPVAGVGPSTCAWCETPFTPGPTSDVARFCSPRCNRSFHKGHSASEHERRRRRVSASVRAALYERDGWRCYLCGLAIRQDVDRNHPLAATLDHVHPMSAGGNEDRRNLRMAHRRCNVDKGDGIGWQSWPEQIGAAS